MDIIGFTFCVEEVWMLTSFHERSSKKSKDADQTVLA
jgi:hypothetical protein